MFWLGAVASASGMERWRLDELLHSLERKEFVRRERRSSVATESEYAFRHLLVRDVAYGQIPRTARADKHRLAATWLEGLGRVEDHAEMLAHHYLAALELARAAGRDASSLLEPAQRALRDAGDRASALNSFPAAARFYGEAASLASAVDPELSFRHAQALYRSGDAASERALEEAREVLVAAGANSRAGEAHAFLAEVWWNRGERDECFRHLSRAEELVRESPPSAAKAHVLSQIARFRALAGEADSAIRAGSEALAIAEELELDELRAHALNNAALAKAIADDPARAMADIERSIEIALAVSSPEAARGYNNLSALVGEIGDFRRARELREETVRVAERMGAAVIHRYARANLPEYRYGAGDWEEALRGADEIIVECERDPYYGEGFARRVRAVIRLARGDGTGALDDVRRSIDIGRRAKDPQALLPALAAGIRVASELGLDEEANEAAELVRALAPGFLGNHLEWPVVLSPVAARLPGVDHIRRAWEAHRDNRG